MTQAHQYQHYHRKFNNMIQTVLNHKCRYQHYRLKSNDMTKTFSRRSTILCLEHFPFDVSLVGFASAKSSLIFVE
jgi:hypothetical protein